MILQIELHLGEMYTVPFADRVVHGRLTAAVIENHEMQLRLKCPSGELVQKVIELPRRL